MPSSSANQDTHDYAERLRERLPRRLQELREGVGLSKYALARASGVSREFLGKLERGRSNPILLVIARAINLVIAGAMLPNDLAQLGWKQTQRTACLRR